MQATFLSKFARMVEVSYPLTLHNAHPSSPLSKAQAKWNERDTGLYWTEGYRGKEGVIDSDKHTLISVREERQKSF